MIYGADRSCYDFDDDIDELFNIARFLIDQSPFSMEEGKVSSFLVTTFLNSHYCYHGRKITYSLKITYSRRFGTLMGCILVVF